MSVFKRPTNGPRLREMAKAVGLDVEAELASGGLAPFEVREAERRCGECRAGRACEIWLAVHKEDHVDQAPHYCPNRGIYRELREAKAAAE